MIVDEGFETHMKNMEKTSGGREIWATDAEIAATARCLKIDIVVIKDEQGKIVKQTFSLADVKEIMMDESFVASQGEKAKILKIVLLNKSNHFELLVPKNELENESQEPWIKHKKTLKKKYMQRKYNQQIPYKYRNVKSSEHENNLKEDASSKIDGPDIEKLKENTESKDTDTMTFYNLSHRKLNVL